MAMVQGVSKLKELLFDREQRELTEINQRIEGLFARTGTDDRLKTSVADVLDGALREAVTKRRDQLEDAVAPFVVKTVRTEIANSQDALVEALYPMTGRLVQMWVTAKIKELKAQVNQTLDEAFSAQGLRLKLRSLATGKTMAELAIAEGGKHRIEELYLIRRGSGELIDHWVRPGAAGVAPAPGRDQIISGFLTAINDFATEAFKADESSLRALDLESHHVYLRASPAYLLAAKCSGTPEVGIETALDRQFLATLERDRDLLARRGLDGGDKADAGKLKQVLPRLATELESSLAAKAEADADRARRRGRTTMLALVSLLVLPLLAWWIYATAASMRAEGNRRRAEQVVASAVAFRGWPVRVEIDHRGSTVSLLGLAPSQEARSELVAAVRRTMSPIPVNDEALSVVLASDAAALRGDLAALEAQLGRSAMRRSLDRAQRKLEMLAAELVRIEHGLPADSAALRELRQALEGVGAELAGQARPAAADDEPRQLSGLRQILARLKLIEARLARMMGGGGFAAQAAPAATPSAAAAAASDAARDTPGHAAVRDLIEVAEEVSLTSERLGVQIEAFERFAAIGGLERRLDELASRRVPIVVTAPPPAAPALPPPTPRQLLEVWQRQHAVFFGNGVEYRDEAAANARLDELVGLLTGNKLYVRVVGYTDSSAVQRNPALATARAEKVLAALVERGVARARLVAVGRPAGPDLAPGSGTNNPNRRVEFEVGFEGEGGDGR